MRAILCSIRPLPSFDDDLKWIWVHTPSTSKKYRPVTSLRHSSTVSQNWLERRRRWDARKNHKWRLQLDTGRRDGRGKRERERLQSSQPELRSTERPTEPTPSDQPTNQQSKCIAPYLYGFSGSQQKTWGASWGRCVLLIPRTRVAGKALASRERQRRRSAVGWRHAWIAWQVAWIKSGRMSIPDTALYVESEEQPHANRNTNVIVPILLSVGSGREYGAVVLRPRRHTRASSLP